jgi:hypothetical protein
LGLGYLGSFDPALRRGVWSLGLGTKNFFGGGAERGRIRR